MTKPTVFAVMQCTIEIPVRPSSPGETFEEMYTAAKREAEGILYHRLGQEFKVIGPVEFKKAVIKEY